MQGRADEAGAGKPGVARSSDGDSDQAQGEVRDLALVIDEFETRWPGQRTLRFLWQTDAALRCINVEDVLAEVVGQASSLAVGQDLAVVAASLDRSGKLQAAIKARSTWSGIEVIWPIAGATAGVTVTLGAVAVLDPDQAFAGLHGYGILRLDRLAPRPTSASLAAQLEAREAAVHPTGSAPLSCEEHERFQALAAELRHEMEGEAVGDRSVALLGSTLGDRAGAADNAAVADPGAKLGADLERIAAADRAAEVARNALPVLERLPIGVLVSRHGIPIFANRALLDLSGFADEDDLHAAGGLDRVLQQTIAAGDMRRVGLITRSGEIVAIEARLQSVDWDDLPASMLTVRRNDGDRLTPSDDQATLADYQEILEISADGVAIMDASLAVLTLNRSAEALLDCDRNKIRGRSFLELVSPESRSVVADYAASLQQGGAQLLLNDGREIMLATARGTIPAFMSLGRLGSGEHEGAGRLCALFRDRTSAAAQGGAALPPLLQESAPEPRRAEADLRVGHDALDQITEIGERLDILFEQLKGSKKSSRRAATEEIADIRDMLGQAVETLAASRAQRPSRGAERLSGASPFDLNAVVREALASAHSGAVRNRLIVRQSLAADMPSVAGDTDQFSRLIERVLLDAAAMAGTGGCVIVATAPGGDGTAVVRVRTRGEGALASAASRRFAVLNAPHEPESGLSRRELEQDKAADAADGTVSPDLMRLARRARCKIASRSHGDMGDLIELSLPLAITVSGVRNT